MSDDTEICGVCGDPKGAHVPTSAGPLTHPREARGEGYYVCEFRPDPDCQCWSCQGSGPRYKFVAAGGKASEAVLPMVVEP